MSGVERLQRAFDRARDEDRAALVIYLCAGDPDLASTPARLLAAAEAGADILEVGMPFSDPTADGPTIQRASERALAAGTTFRGVLEAVAAVRAKSDVPIVLFGYYNPILRYGERALCADAARAGVDGMLVVDLPVEAAAPLTGPLAEHGMAFVPLVAPTSDDARVDRAAAAAGSFLYYVSVTGVTGSGDADLATASQRAASIGRRTGRPVAVGFGVRTPEDVRVVALHADAVVVGSAAVEASYGGGPEAVGELVAGLRAATGRAAS